MKEEERILKTKEWLEKGYLLYLYLSSATKMYEWKPIDPEYYKDSKITLEGFRKKYTATHKLYNNIEEMLSDRQKLNRSLPVMPQDKEITVEEQLNKAKVLIKEMYDQLCGRRAVDRQTLETAKKILREDI